jgi:transcriptional regulator with XRE-family HTH domain
VKQNGPFFHGDIFQLGALPNCETVRRRGDSNDIKQKSLVGLWGPIGDIFLVNKINHTARKASVLSLNKDIYTYVYTQPYENIGFYLRGDFVNSLRVSVGAKIKALRKSSKMSQADLGHFLGCDTSLIGRYERGIHLPGIEQLIRIAELFNVGPGELLPSGQDLRRARLIELREKITNEMAEVTSPEALEGILESLTKLRAENKPPKN